MTETKNLLPRIDETLKEARDRHFADLPRDGDSAEFETAQASLQIPEEHRYAYRKTLAALALVAISPLLVKSWATSQHYGYHGNPNPNIPTQTQP